MDKELSIEEVIENLRAEYERAKKKSFVAKPMAYALHSVWKAVYWIAAAVLNACVTF